MAHLPTVRFVVAYFGAWPVWMPLFLESCKFNKGFNWLLFGDHSWDSDTLSNVHFEVLKIGEFNNLAKRETGLSFGIQNPYKVCDVKPMFGRIFRKYLRGWDFWGSTDIDLIYGDLNSYKIRQALQACDVYTASENLVGHFTLYRNTPKINNLFYKMQDLKKAYSNETTLTGNPLGFDEKQMVEVLQGENNVCYGHLESYINELKKKKPAAGGTIMPFGQILGENLSGNERYHWKDGKTIQLKGPKIREFMYLHFFMWKADSFWRRFKPDIGLINEFWLDDRGWSMTKPKNRVFFKRIIRLVYYYVRNLLMGIKWLVIFGVRGHLFR